MSSSLNAYISVCNWFLSEELCCFVWYECLHLGSLDSSGFLPRHSLAVIRRVDTPIRIDEGCCGVRKIVRGAAVWRCGLIETDSSSLISIVSKMKMTVSTPTYRTRSTCTCSGRVPLETAPSAVAVQLCCHREGRQLRCALSGSVSLRVYRRLSALCEGERSICRVSEWQNQCDSWSWRVSERIDCVLWPSVRPSMGLLLVYIAFSCWCVISIL